MSELLRIEGLHVRYDGPRGPVRAVDGVDLAVRRGETYALVGESGCGKSATALAILDLVEPGRVTAGRVWFDGVDLTSLTEREFRRYRGGRIGMVFQEPGAALNPVLRAGAQVAEAIRAHRKIDRRAVREAVVAALARVRLPDPERVARSYPHELSGGMQQRVMLAIALACDPVLLIADEPTTALDVTIQAQILELLRTLREEIGLSVLLVAHDLAVVAENADRVGVMYAGRLVEEAPTAELFASPGHPYTRALLRAIPGRGDGARTGRLVGLEGTVPDPVAPPPGCRFHPRCPERFGPCDRDDPALQPAGPARRVACHLGSAGRPGADR
jgi:oligopeptide/dipeptide ABC transporter ATP-binding protein